MVKEEKKEPEIVDLQNTSGVWTMQAVYNAKVEALENS